MNNINFPTVREFQDYFTQNETLEIPQEKPLHIVDPRPLNCFFKRDIEIKESPVEKKKFFLYLFNKLVAPIGKKLFYKSEGPQKVRMDNTDGLLVTFSKGCVIRAVKAQEIFTRASELFQLMVASSRLTFKLDPGQKLYFMGLKKTDLNNQDVLEHFKSAVPAGYHASLSIVDGLSCQTQAWYVNPQPQNAICLQAQNLQISLCEADTYNFDEDAFVERMILHPILNVPAGKTLKIRGEFIRKMGRLWSENFKDHINVCSFALMQLFLPYGKNAKITDCIFSYDDDLISIDSNSGFTVTLIDGKQSMIDWRILGRRMIEKQRTFVTIPPNQQVFFYGLDEYEKGAIEWEKGDDFQLQHGLKDFFLQRLPIGFTWNFRFFDKLQFQYSSCRTFLILSSPAKMVFSLSRPKDPGVFAWSIVQNSPLSLGKALVDYDVQAIMNFLFRSIGCFFFDNFRYCKYLEIPAYFKDVTREKINETLEDEIFTKHLAIIESDDALREKIQALFRANPKEFDLAELDPDGSIAFIIKKIKEIAALELQNSTYLTDATQTVVKYLENHPKYEDRH